MPKPIEINTAILVRMSDGSYALDLIQDDGETDLIYRFRLTEEAAMQLRQDSLTEIPGAALNRPMGSPREAKDRLDQTVV